MPYQTCCTHPKKVSYSLLHTPKPLPLNKAMLESIVQLLWYVPNIASKQSNQNKIVSELIYDDFCFSILKRTMHLDDNDVELQNYDIEEQVVNQYKNEVCQNCQKMILKKSKQTSFVSALLRHVRNCIAHGNFTILDNGMLVGFDEIANQKKCTAIIKLYPESLLAALHIINSMLVQEQLVMYAFNKVGYEVVSQHDCDNCFDYLLTKNGKQIGIELKRVKQAKYVDRLLFDELFTYLSKMNNTRSIPVVYLLDTSKLTIAQKLKLMDAQITIIDMSMIKSLLKGIDVLAHIHE